MECVEQRQETGRKPKCEDGFSIIYGLILVVEEEEASLDLGIYTVCTEAMNDFPAIRILRRFSVTVSPPRLCELLGSVVALVWPRAAVQ